MADDPTRKPVWMDEFFHKLKTEMRNLGTTTVNSAVDRMLDRPAVAPSGFFTPQSSQSSSPSPASQPSPDRAAQCQSPSVRAEIVSFTPNTPQAKDYNQALRSLKTQHDWTDTPMRDQDASMIQAVIRGLSLTYPSVPASTHQYKLSQSFINNNKEAKRKALLIEKKRNAAEESCGSLTKELSEASGSGEEEVCPLTQQVTIY